METNKRWSPEEDELALKLYKQGKTYKEIALRLGRSKAAVNQRINNKTRKTMDINEASILSRRMELNFDVGSVYEISPIGRSPVIDYLQEKFIFLEEIAGQNCNMYVFKSVKGHYKTTFSNRQIPGSYIFRKVDG
jgi:predicted transcriptional regulator